jgi:hypothetical protein
LIVQRSNPALRYRSATDCSATGLNPNRQKAILLPAFSAVAMTKEEERELREQLARLQQEHRDLDAAISALQHSQGSDLLQVQRLKKRKLYLRDRISHIEDQLTPDIIA